MFGMNDVGRGNYVAEPNEQQRAAQRQALERYRANMERLTARLRAEAGSRVCCLSRRRRSIKPGSMTATTTSRV